ncbi:MAG: hypothetical protein RL596_2567 [Bacteroidota bacterium]
MRKNIPLLIFLFISATLQAQGDGPRSFLLLPKGVTGLSSKWLQLNQNLIPAGTALIPGADIKVNVFPNTLFHTFSIKNHFAQVYFMINPGNATASTKIGPPIGPIPTNKISNNGLADGLIGFRIGIQGAPAVSVKEFAKAPSQVSVFADFRYWYSGSYDAGNLLNMGTNRSIFQFGLPFAIPLHKGEQHATWLEIAPALLLFTANNDPSRASFAKQVTQKPLFTLENHLSHNFTSKFWGSLDLRIQQGGRTQVDGKNEDNNISVIAGGLTVGYQLIAPIGITASYGGVVVSDQAKGKMIRLGVVFAYANLKK